MGVWHRQGLCKKLLSLGSLHAACAGLSNEKRGLWRCHTAIEAIEAIVATSDSSLADFKVRQVELQHDATS